jgi:hypothetical protein
LQLPVIEYVGVGLNLQLPVIEYVEIQSKLQLPGSIL